MKLNVNEIFYSLQGEGVRQGAASIFIRLTRCNLACEFCDTDFENGQDMTLEEIEKVIKVFPCRWIVWTGGEPTLQLTDSCLQFFRDRGYKQAVETNGTRAVPSLIDYITCSPKGNYRKAKEVVPAADEVRIPIRAGGKLPPIEELPEAGKYFISPVFDGDRINPENVAYCVKLVQDNPIWNLSLQIHKLIHIE